MTSTNVPDAPVGPPGYCGSIADELRRIAAAFDSVGHHELPEPRSVQLWIQPGGEADSDVIAGVDVLGKAVLGITGEPLEMSSGSYHYKVYGDCGPVEVKFFRSIDAAHAERMLAEREIAEKNAELAKLRAKVAELEATAPVSFCGWCPNPDRPDPARHPGGQREHLKAAADPSGLLYQREADDPTPVSPARGWHGGAMVGDTKVAELVDETPAEAATLSAAIRFSEARREAFRLTGRTTSERLHAATLDLLHGQALEEDVDRTRRADLRQGEQGRVTGPKMARFLAEREDARRSVHYLDFGSDGEEDDRLTCGKQVREVSQYTDDFAKVTCSVCIRAMAPVSGSR